MDLDEAERPGEPRDRTAADAETAIRNWMIYGEARYTDSDVHLVLAELERQVAALAARDAEVARLGAARERALVLADDLDKEAGEDSPTDTPRVTDPASRGYLAGVANAYGEAARRLRLSLAITAVTVNSELGVAALAAAPAPAEDDDDDGHGPWLYTEFGVLCSCRYPVDADERCTRPRDAAGQREELIGALFETADNLLEHLAQTGSVAAEDSHVDDLRHARDALAEWHAPAPAREQADPAGEGADRG